MAMARRKQTHGVMTNKEDMAMKFMTNIKTLTALLMAGAAFTACSSSDEIIEQPANPTKPKTCTLTIKASKGSDATRALDLSNKTLNATWTAGDKVAVYYMHPKAMGEEIMYTPTEIGTLEAQSSGASTTLTGEITTTGITIGGPTFGDGPSETHDLTTDDKLYLSYSGTLGEGVQVFNQQQDGTLQKLSDYFDNAGADVTVSSVSGSTVSINEASAQFENLSYIIRFTLQDNAGNAISPSSLAIQCQTTGDYPVVGTANIDIPDATYTANGAGVVFVKLPQTNQTTGFTGDITMTATVGSATYTYTKTGVTFTNGKYYEITVKMFDQSKIIDLSGVTAAGLTAQYGSATLTLVDGDVLTGTLDGSTEEGKVKIEIAAGATVTLYNAHINGQHYGGGSDTECLWAGINCLGNATIILSGENSVTNFNRHYPAILAAHNTGSVDEYTLTIRGSGMLTATNAYLGAGIGGGNMIDCGNIRIEGGDITATGGHYSAGIGGGSNSSCGDITINGGTIKATGGTDAAGIGSGCSSSDNSSSGNISISGGTVTATGGDKGAGIGSGSSPSINSSSSGNITINGGTVTATGGPLAAGIGCGFGNDNSPSSCGVIWIGGNGPDGIKKFSVTAIKGSDALRPIGHSSKSNEQNSCGDIIFGMDKSKKVYNPSQSSYPESYNTDNCSEVEFKATKEQDGNEEEIDPLERDCTTWKLWREW